jgi:hypothetical protein
MDPNHLGPQGVAVLEPTVFEELFPMIRDHSRDGVLPDQVQERPNVSIHLRDIGPIERDNARPIGRAIPPDPIQIIKLIPDPLPQTRRWRLRVIGQVRPDQVNDQEARPAPRLDPPLGRLGHRPGVVVDHRKPVETLVEASLVAHKGVRANHPAGVAL